VKKHLLLWTALLAIDLITPAIHTGAQVAIAPLIIAAIIGAVSSAAAAQKAQQGAQDAATAGAAGKDKGSMDMQPTVTYDPKAGREAADSTGVNPYVAAMGGQDPQALMMQMKGMSEPSAGPTSKMQAEVDRANANKPPVIAPTGTNYTAMPQQPGAMTGQAPSQLDAKLNNDMSMAAQNGVPAAAPEEGMTWDEKMQYASMAASVGAALSGAGKAPPPPGLRSGGGINMQPVFMSARRAYGG